jgi:hypothetical protein
MAEPLPYEVGCVLQSGNGTVWLYAGEYSKERHSYVCVRTVNDGRVSITRCNSHAGPRDIVPIPYFGTRSMELHADDGPAYVLIGGALDSTLSPLDAALTAHTRPDVIEYQYNQHSKLAAPPGYDGPVLARNTMLQWYRDGRLHRDPDENGVDRPAQILGLGLMRPPGDPYRIEYGWMYYADGERHRDVGPCVIDHRCICGACSVDVEKSDKFGVRLKAGPPYQLEWNRTRLDGPISVTCNGTQHWVANGTQHWVASIYVLHRRPFTARLNGEIQWVSDWESDGASDGASKGVPETYSRYTHSKYPAAARKAARAIVACSARPNFLAVDLRTWIVEIHFGE